MAAGSSPILKMVRYENLNSSELTSSELKLIHALDGWSIKQEKTNFVAAIEEK